MVGGMLKVEVLACYGVYYLFRVGRHCGRLCGDGVVGWRSGGVRGELMEVGGGRSV